MDIKTFISNHYDWSTRAFGSVNKRGHLGPLKHLRKEIDELAEKPSDPLEAADVIILAIDVAMRAGVTSSELTEALIVKQRLNALRKWPADVPANEPIEHIK